MENQKVEIAERPSIKQEVPCALEERMKKAGLVDIQSLDSSIQVDLKYSSEDNFLKQDIYGCLENAYLHKEAAQRLLS